MTSPKCRRSPLQHKNDVLNRPVVSIGLPVCNGGRTIHKAIASILAQTYPDFELIISDNASSDATERICREYAEKDARIRYVRQRSNIGAVANFRFVLDAAQYERFIWAAADDWWDTDRLERLVSALTARDAAVIGTIRRYLDGQPCAQFIPRGFRHKAFWKYLMREESRCEKVYFIYGLLWKEFAQDLFVEENMGGYWGDAIFVYGLVWRGNLKSIRGATLHVTVRHDSSGMTAAKRFRYSLTRVLYRAHPWGYYARYWKLTPREYRAQLLLAIIIKALSAQLHLWWRAFRRLVLKKPYVHGALEGGERRALKAGL